MKIQRLEILVMLRERLAQRTGPLRLMRSSMVTDALVEELRQIILDGIWYKPWGHGLAEGVIPLNRVMSEIGG